jgi:hypothetical protein
MSKFENNVCALLSKEMNAFRIVAWFFSVLVCVALVVHNSPTFVPFRSAFPHPRVLLVGNCPDCVPPGSAKAIDAFPGTVVRFNYAPLDPSVHGSRCDVMTMSDCRHRSAFRAANPDARYVVAYRINNCSLALRNFWGGEPSPVTFVPRCYDAAIDREVPDASHFHSSGLFLMKLFVRLGYRVYLVGFDPGSGSRSGVQDDVHHDWSFEHSEIRRLRDAGHVRFL